MRAFIAQINPTVGDLSGNLLLIQNSILQAISSECDVAVFPELMTTGYPPRDLLYSQIFWEDHKNLIDKLHFFIKQQSRQIAVIVGGLHEEMLSGGRYARYNAAWILDKHFGRRVVHKQLLPCYDVFDETRYFSPEVNNPYSSIPIHMLKNGFEYDVPCDVLICEDIWNNNQRGGEEWMKPSSYTIDPIENVERYGKGPLFVLNGSPFWIGKIKETQKLVESICDRIRQPVIWCNQIGSHDDIVTGGYSMVSVPTYEIGRTGRPLTRMCKAFQEDSMVVRLGDDHTNHSNLNEGRDIQADLVDPIMLGTTTVADVDYEMWTIYKSLFLHMSDYKSRCGFKRAIIGLSGGIDSAVVAVVAAHVFGGKNVTGISMPSPYSSEGSVIDAKNLAKNLKIRFEIKKITDTYEAVKNLFLSGGKQEFVNSLADENIQPRVRGMILMAHSNEYDPCLLLTTGNKSEITVGYCTIYGDMCGGLAVISDLWKTQVYGLARFMNKYFDNPIPVNTIKKPASAELRPDQKDTDSLPPYEVLDPLLKLFVEQEMSPFQVFASNWFKKHQGLAQNQIDSGMVNVMYRKYRNAEYKRLQMPVGPKISRRAFTSGWRMPIACKITYI